MSTETLKSPSSLILRNVFIFHIVSPFKYKDKCNGFGRSLLLKKRITQNKAFCNIENCLLDTMHNQGKVIFSCHEHSNQLLHGAVIDCILKCHLGTTPCCDICQPCRTVVKVSYYCKISCFYDLFSLPYYVTVIANFLARKLLMIKPIR